MKFRSYAQNFEDVILNRAFKDQADGFYVDVGACHPSFHSVTRAFYDRGWAGINIEPGSAVFDRIVYERGRDTNLNVGVSNQEGSMTFFESPDSVGCSTFRDSWREGWSQRAGFQFDEKTVPITTLTKVFEQHVGDRRVDFLKIDVEGHEREVLEGMDFARWQPRVILVEGDPKVAQEWQHYMTSAGYLFAGYDGINCYYASKDEAHLVPILGRPVSCIDDFEMAETSHALNNYDGEVAAHAATKAAVAGLEAELDAARRRIADLEGEIAAPKKRKLRLWA